MKTFLNSKELSLKNGGYLISVDGKPVSNSEFNAAQKDAEFVVTLANEAKGKDFKGKTPDSISDLRNKVSKQLNSTEATVFVKGPKMGKRPTTEALKDEAFAFLAFQKEDDSTAKVNAFLQKFNVINEFETFGLFFEDEVSKLNKIYTMKDIIEAVTSMIQHLD